MEEKKEFGKKKVMRGGNMLYPVPAVMVSCAPAGSIATGLPEKDPAARPNIITVAWAGTVCSDPAMVSISVRKNRYSHDIIERSGEFVINLVTEKLTKACDWCGVKSGRDSDKFAAMHLTPGKAQKLEYAPLIKESPVNIECKVKQVIPLGSHDMFLAEVVCVDADEVYFNENGKFELDRAGLMAYCHGEYFALGRKLGTFGYSVRRSGTNHRSSKSK